MIFKILLFLVAHSVGLGICATNAFLIQAANMVTVLNHSVAIAMNDGAAYYATGIKILAFIRIRAKMALAVNRMNLIIILAIVPKDSVVGIVKFVSFSFSFFLLLNEPNVGKKFCRVWG